ncbi:MAG: 3-phosphoshikimate 1-carboxyvinyltransferase [Candidatus Altiarchaeota archaeon]
MDLTVNSSEELKGTVKAPPSKSYTIRAYIASLLANGTSTIIEPLDSLDTNACLDAIKILGAKVKEVDGGLEITGVEGEITHPGKTIDTKNSGTTIRILTAVAASSKEKIMLTGDESVCKRPMGPLLEALEQLGVETSSVNGCPPVTVKGPIHGGECVIAGNISSQFISGLLIALGLAKRDTTLKVTTDLRSKPYVDLTLDVLKKFRVRIENRDYKEFYIMGERHFHPITYTVEGDYSSAAFILAAAALTKSDVTVKNLFRDSKQADKQILKVLQVMGADLEVDRDSIRVRGDGKLHGGVFDLSDAPDLVPIVSVLGACASGETILENVEHARFKECDRIDAMATELAKMEAYVEQRQDGLLIEGGPLVGGKLNGWKDHRVVMALAIAGLKASGETKIKGAQYIDVTFPEFKTIMQGIGANIC